MQKHLSRPSRVPPIHPAGTENPFPRQPSLNYQAFRLAMDGTTLEEINKLADQRGGDARRLVTLLRSRGFKNWTWELDENNGILKVHDLKRTEVLN